MTKGNDHAGSAVPANAGGSGSNGVLGAVSVTYSPGRHVDELIASLPQAYHGEIELILADNGSIDGAPEAAAQENQRVEFFPTGGNIGYGAAINAAVQHLAARRDRGEIDPRYILVTNPDVVFHPGSIDALIECAQRHDDAGAIGPVIREDDGSAYPSARAVPTITSGLGHALFGTIWPNNPWSKQYRLNEDMENERTAGWLSGACLLLKWEAFEKLGGFDERYFMYLEDMDLGDRLSRAGYTSVLCPSAEIAHDQGHAANAHRSLTLSAHHESAYRFFSDRLPKWWQAPLRAGIGVGLMLRSRLLKLLEARSARRTDCRR